jgi:NAD(P)H-dependent FMN reductase
MILILNASPRKHGVTTSILKSIADGAAADHQIEWVDVNRLSIQPCVGCLKCRPDKVCVLPQDDAHRVGELIERSDALIVGSPTYWGNVTGPLKLLFDRNVPTFEYIGDGLPKPKHTGKKAIVVVVSSAPFPFNLLPSQSRGTVRALGTVLRAAGYTIAKTINVPGSGGFEQRRHKVLARAEKIGRNLQ